ncbi:type VII secretion protein EccB [Streptomyces sp. NPDC048639]|uniref:type VII secretion protein EccB n=1 Tax=Streptomyces sp. NPDC048639 TaxID=3365581 RepID=UPI0037233ACE
MASRRDELNAYSFARKRTVASFLKPLPNGSTESAPRPMRTIVPTILLGTVILVGFGACGLIKPVAPQGWNTPGGSVIVGDESTTRYVVLCGVETKEGEACPKGKDVLHPVLNLASARLVLGGKSKDVVKVKESVLDGPTAPKHGPTIGIPYAPDRLPDQEDAKTKKTWALCERPGVNERSKAQRAVFVFGSSDRHLEKLKEDDRGALNKREALFVEDPDGIQYLVDERGVAHKLDAAAAQRLPGQSPLPGDRQSQQDLLRRILFGEEPPQKVTKEWMDTVYKSPFPIVLPTVPGAGEPSSAEGVPEEHRTIGKVLESRGQHYVVLGDELQRVSDFVAELLIHGPVGQAAYPDETPKSIGVVEADIDPADNEGFFEEFDGREIPWPTERARRANTWEQEEGDRVVCSVYYGSDRKIAGKPLGVPEMSAWAGKDYPAPVNTDSGSAYVTPGSGLLYKQTAGKATDGTLFLVTDTGLRYSVQRNNDSGSGSGNAESQEQDQARVRLGYEGITNPPGVPKEWSSLLSAGPSLNTDDAKQPQGS